MKFKDLIEGYDAQRRFIRQNFDGMSNTRQLAETRFGPKYEKSLAEAASFIADVFDGRRKMWQLKEALSTSDFPLLFGDTIDRMMYASFQERPGDWRDYVKVVNNIADFRDVKRFRCTRGADRLYGPMGQAESYEADAVEESQYTYAVQKYGRRRDILWEALVNDDLGALQDAPADLAYQSRNTEWYVATSLFAANATLYNATHAVNGTNYSNVGTDELTAEALAEAISQMSEFPADDGESPVFNDPSYLVVGTKEMEFKANQILNSILVAYTGASDRGNLGTASIIPQEVRSAMKIRYNPWLRVLDPTYYDTSWYLFSEPSVGWAVEVGFLAGHEAPELFMKDSNQVLMGGGMTSPMDGDFDNDAVAYKARHVIGGSHTNAVGGWRFTFWSNGTVSQLN